MKAQGRFDKTAADRAVAFIESLRHTKGRWAGSPFKLAKWQRDDIIRPLFGTLNPDGTRQYRTAYVELPRGNGKSALAATIALYLLCADREQGAEIYGAGVDRDQAGIVFSTAAEMARRQPALARRCKIIDSTKRIVYPRTGSFYRAIPSDAAGGHGFNPHGIIFDEFHVQRTRDLYDALSTAGGKREQPLIFIITTAGYDRQSICWELHEYARQVIEGTVDDPTFFAYIRAAPEEADWRSRKVWRACNPALGDFRSLDEMVAFARRAVHIPALQNTFRRLYLNQWTQQADRWIDINLWDANAGVVDEEKLRGRRSYGGLDLGAFSDMTAWALAFPRDDDEEELDVLVRYWCPAKKLTDSANRYRASYQAWAREGWLTPTPGEAIDYGFVKAKILEDAQKFQLVNMNVDRLFQAHQLSCELIDELGEGRVAGMGQGFLSMAAPMAELSRRLLARKLHHGGNPVLRWNADNLAVKQDPAGNLKPDKSSSQGLIDGLVAVVMALERAMRHQEHRSVYEDRGVRQF